MRRIYAVVIKGLVFHRAQTEFASLLRNWY